MSHQHILDQVGLDSYSLQMSFSKYISTGNPILDNVIFSIIGIYLAAMVSMFNWKSFKKLFKKIKHWIWGDPVTVDHDYNEITISQTKMKDRTGEFYRSDFDGFEKQNHHLFDAFCEYLGKRPELVSASELGLEIDHELDYIDDIMRANSMNLRPVEKVDITWKRPDNGDNDDVGDEMDFTIYYEQVSPKNKKKSETDRDDPEDESSDSSDGLFRRKKRRKRAKKKEEPKAHQHIITVRSRESTKVILEFIKAVYMEYVEKNYPVEEKKDIVPKYYFIRKSEAGKKSYFIRYDLKSKTTFEDVFFPEKEKLMARINQFVKGETKLSKFTILLHGPPGGGKSSFIKALHNLTGNHVVVVKLSQYNSLDELMGVFHKAKMRMADWNQTVPVKKRIYLFEDIDAEDKIVLKRKNGKKENNAGNSPAIPGATTGAGAGTVDGTNSDDDSDDENSSENTDARSSEYEFTTTSGEMSNLDKSQSSNRSKVRFKGKKTKPQKALSGGKQAQPSYWEQRMMGWGNPWGMGPMTGAGGKTGKNFKGGATNQWDWWKNNQKPAIKLSDVLNLLDGVLELNECFIVMTTNHLDKLDPALIRPGRITYQQEMTYITIPSMKLMIQKFIPSYDPEQSDPRIDEILPQIKKCMPCIFETFCQNEIDLDGVITQMQNYLRNLQG